MEKIKQLRDRTGAGIVDCKKALEESGGDIDKAIEILRKKGIAKAAKRTEREAGEGVIKLSVNDAQNEAYILEVNSETDFVARNEKFQDFSDKVLAIIASLKPSNLDELLSLDMDGVSVKDTLDSFSGVIGEKLSIGRFEIISSGSVAVYSHMAGRIGAVVALDKEGQSDLARDIAMHVAASNPKYLSSDEVPQDEIDKEKSVYREQLLKEGKPENMLEKIMEGKINKYFEEICLLKQEFIKDDKKKIGDLLDGVSIEKFVRFSL